MDVTEVNRTTGPLTQAEPFKFRAVLREHTLDRSLDIMSAVASRNQDTDLHRHWTPGNLSFGHRRLVPANRSGTTASWAGRAVATAILTSIL